MSDADDVARWVATINDDPDAAHGDYTPAVHALIRRGLPALRAVLPLLVADDEWTRLRAQRVLEGVTRDAIQQDRAPARPLSQATEQAWLALWQDNGAYDWRASAQAREAAVGRWRGWLERRGF